MSLQAQALADGRIAFASDRDGNSEIYVMNSDGTNQTRLTFNAGQDGSPVFNADGSKIAFQSDRDGNYEIYIMNADGSGQTRLTSNNAVDVEPDFSPDGTKITFFSERDGNSEIYLMNVNGTNQVNLTNDTAVDYGPSFKPDGVTIAFASSRDTTGGIYTVNINSQTVNRLTTQSDFAPDYSPDGNKITFHSTRDGNPEMYIMDADGKNQVNLTNNAADDSYGMFSPTGSQIVFGANRSGNYEIYTADVNGSGQTNISRNTAKDVAPSWAPGSVPNLPSMSVNDPTSAKEGSAAGGNVVNFTVKLSAASAQTVTAQYNTTDGVNNGAKAGSDYFAKSGTLTFAPGETSKTLQVIFIGDSVAELNEPFFFDIKTPVNAKITDSRGSTYIKNDDGPSVTIDNAKTIDEGNSGTTPQTFTVHLSAASTNTVTVNWATANGSAGPADYTVASGALTFAPGETSKTITILVKGDTTVEPTETYKVNLSSPTYAVLADSQGSAYIRNDDVSTLKFDRDAPSE